MKQIEIKALLIEAADPGCSWERRNAIQCELGHASPAMREDGVFEIEGRAAGMQLVLDGLYVETIRHHPGLLPTLLPAFAIICGDREEGMICANIDWTIA